MTRESTIPTPELPGHTKRVWADVKAGTDRLAGVRRIGIDEVSYKRQPQVPDGGGRPRHEPAAVGSRRTGQGDLDRVLRAARAVAVLPDHPRQRGRDAGFIEVVVAEYCPDAVRVAGPFHVVKWATDALDPVRQASWAGSAAPGPGRTAPPRRRPPRRRAAAAAGTERAKALKGCRFAFVEEPRGPDRKPTRAAGLGRRGPTRRSTAPTCSRKAWEADLPDAARGAAPRQPWTGGSGWARRSRMPALVKLATQHRRAPRGERPSPRSSTTCPTGWVESTNTKFRLITRMAYGFASPQPLIALALLSLGGNQPHPPGPHMTHGYVRRAFRLVCPSLALLAQTPW